MGNSSCPAGTSSLRQFHDFQVRHRPAENGAWRRRRLPPEAARIGSSKQISARLCNRNPVGARKPLQLGGGVDSLRAGAGSEAHGQSSRAARKTADRPAQDPARESGFRSPEGNRRSAIRGKQRAMSKQTFRHGGSTCVRLLTCEYMSSAALTTFEFAS